MSSNSQHNAEAASLPRNDRVQEDVSMETQESESKSKISHQKLNLFSHTCGRCLYTIIEMYV